MIGIGFTCTHHAPTSWNAKYKGLVLVNSTSNFTSRIAISTETDDCDRLIDELIESQFPVQSFNFAWDRLYFDWSNAEDCWTGAVIGYDDYVKVSPDNEFSPSFSAPCDGIVPPTVPLQILGRPKDHVVGAGFDKIFSEALCDFISSRDECEFIDVLSNGRVIKSHRRIILKRREVIASDGLTNAQCVFCKTRIISDIGVLLGHRVTNFSVCESAIGMGHLGLERDYVFSVQAAEELTAMYRRTFGLRPILDIDSTRGLRVLTLLKKLQHLNFQRV